MQQVAVADFKAYIFAHRFVFVAPGGGHLHGHAAHDMALEDTADQLG